MNKQIALLRRNILRLGNKLSCLCKDILGLRSDVDSLLDGGVALPPTEIKTLYESNPDTNAFTDEEKKKLLDVFDKSVDGFSEVPYTPSLKVGDPSHIDNLQEVINHIASAGVVHGCDLIDNVDGTIDIEAGYALLRALPDPHESIYAVEVTVQENLALTPDAINYVYLDWNSGTPQFVASTSPSSFNCLEKCLAYVVYLDIDNATIKEIDAREQNIDISTKVRRLFFDFSRFIHSEGGTALSESGTRNISVTEGSFYFMVKQILHVAFDTSVAGTANENVYTLYYQDTPSGFVKTTGEKQINNTLWDNNGVQTTIGNNKYGVSWVYIINDSPSELAVLRGQQEYPDLASAKNATIPTNIPSIISGLGSLIGLVVYEKGATNFDDVLSAFERQFVSSQATTHNGLAGIQGGIATERYHLNTLQYTQAIILDKLDATTAPTVSDDNTEGYSIGSEWFDITNKKKYSCLDASTGAAIWKEAAGGTNDVVMHTSSFISAGGTATNSLIFVGNEITIRALGGGDNQTSFIVDDLVVPKGYVSGGQLKIWVRRNGAVDSHVMTAWINDVVDSTINAVTILATADLTWELKTLTFGSTIAPYDVINIEVFSQIDNNVATYLKASTFTYN